MRAAEELLATAGPGSLLAIAKACGCTGAPHALTQSDRKTLALDPLGPPDSARIARGPGALRALIIAVEGDAAADELLPRIAARLARRAPHLDWLCVMDSGSRAAGTLTLATWTAEDLPPRLVRLTVDRARVHSSDIETLVALATIRGPGDVHVHRRWVEILGRESLTRRFYRDLSRAVIAMAESATTPAGSRIASFDHRHALAVLYASRCLFLAFLQTKGWLDGDPSFLSRMFSECVAAGGKFHRHILQPLFFGTLNTPVARRAPAARRFGRIPFLNGGLFGATSLDRRLKTTTFTDAALGTLVADVLDHYRFTPRESSRRDGEAAVDPEMLGRAFETLMALERRHALGTYYTPTAVVSSMTRDAVIAMLSSPRIPPDGVSAMLRGEPVDRHITETVRTALPDVRILDPACGSGTFLVAALELLCVLAERAGDTRTPSERRRMALARSIYGVDVDPTAVWLCELRLWLTVTIDADERATGEPLPLPNLDRNVRVGDALAGTAFTPFDGADGARRDLTVVREGARIARLREQYGRATGGRKRSVLSALDRAERERAIDFATRELTRLTAARSEAIILARGRDLFGNAVSVTATKRQRDALRHQVRVARARLRALREGAALPFSFANQFADIGARGGFDLVIGNPPWVRPHAVPIADRQRLRRSFVVSDTPHLFAGASHGFGAQVDLAALFAERALALTRRGGVAALLVPAKLWRSLAGAGLRSLITSQSSLLALEDWSTARSMFDAAAYPSLIMTRRIDPVTPNARDEDSRAGGGAQSTPTTPPPVRLAIHTADRSQEWHASPGSLALDDTPGSPWLLLPARARSAFDAIRAVGRPLISQFGPPRLGVKCGCNAAFIVTQCERETRHADASHPRLIAVRGDPVSGSRASRVALVERELLRPVVRGSTLRSWNADGAALRRAGGAQSPATEGEATTWWIVWTHADRADGSDTPLDQLPPHAEAWLLPWQRQLMARSDRRGTVPWWALFRTESARRDVSRVVWADIGRSPRAAVLAAGDRTVPLNSCYAVPTPTIVDAQTLAALLNSVVLMAWLKALAEPARGGYRRYLGWTVGLLPLPAHWERACQILAPFAIAGAAGRAVDSDELSAAVLASYQFDHRQVEPLLEWARL